MSTMPARMGHSLFNWPVPLGFGLPERWHGFFEPGAFIKVEEFVDGEILVLRAELPGVDPEKDVELTVEEGVLHIHGERREATKHEAKDHYRSEFHSGSFDRSIVLPATALPEEILASYKEGILEIRIPVGELKQSALRIPVKAA